MSYGLNTHLAKVMAITVYMYVCVDRWGDNRSPAFGELSDSHFFRPVEGSKEDRLAMWGQVQAYTFTYSIATTFVHSYDLFINVWAKVFNFFSVCIFWCCINICINLCID